MCLDEAGHVRVVVPRVGVFRPAVNDAPNEIVDRFTGLLIEPHQFLVREFGDVRAHAVAGSARR